MTAAAASVDRLQSEQRDRGWIFINSHRNRSGLIQGEPTVMRAEMGAAAMAVMDADPRMDLIVSTDSLALLLILVLWTLLDFTMYNEN